MDSCTPSASPHTTGSAMAKYKTTVCKIAGSLAAQQTLICARRHESVAADYRTRRKPYLHATHPTKLSSRAAAPEIVWREVESVDNNLNQLGKVAVWQLDELMMRCQASCAVATNLDDELGCQRFRPQFGIQPFGTAPVTIRCNPSPDQIIHRGKSVKL